MTDSFFFLSVLTHSKISVTRDALAVELELGKRIQSVQIKGVGWHSPFFVALRRRSLCATSANANV